MLLFPATCSIHVQTFSSPDDIHGLVDYVRLVYGDDLLGPSLGCKEGEYPRPTPNVQHHLVAKQRRVLLNEKLVCLRASLILQHRQTSKPPGIGLNEVMSASLPSAFLRGS